MLPDIPQGWSQAIAAVGAIIVVLFILKWTGEILAGHGKLSDLLINRSYDLVDKVVDKAVPSPPEEPEPVPAEIEATVVTSEPEPAPVS
jgi:hypothetical protein